MESYSRIDRWRSFLYRRLARWITCEVKLLGQHPLALDNKFQVNSLQDVFCHPFYWQLYNWLLEPPQQVVDLESSLRSLGCSGSCLASASVCLG